METFIKIRKTYNPITGQGENDKIINTNHIVHITDWSKMHGKVKGVKTRIYLSTGLFIDTIEAIEDIQNTLISGGINIIE